MPVVADHTAALLGALRARLTGVSGLPSSRAWENVTFTPVVGQAYVGDAWLGGPEQAAEVGPGPLIRGRYLYQVTVFWPASSGVHDALKLADKIADAMRSSSLTIAGSPHPARVSGVKVGPRIQDAANWYSLPISVSVDMDF